MSKWPCEPRSTFNIRQQKNAGKLGRAFSAGDSNICTFTVYQYIYS